MPKKFKKYSDFAPHVESLGDTAGEPSAVAHLAPWSAYAVALGAMESLAAAGLSTGKVARRHKKAVKRLRRFAKAAGGKHAVRPPHDNGTPVPIEAGAANVVDIKAAKKKQKGMASSDLIDEGRPQGITAPRDGSADDLKLIAGVGPKLEVTLNQLGIWHFDQIAAWSEHEVAWVDHYLQFKGRIERDEWIAQAAALADGGRDEYVRRFGKEPR